MTTEVRIDDNTFCFSHYSGEILDSQKRTETRVSSQVGYSGPIISSTVDTVHEMWIKQDDGREIAIKAYDDVPLRVGQRVTVICTELKGAKNYIHSALLNHATGENRFLCSAEALVDYLGLKKRSGCLITTVKLIVGFSATIWLLSLNYKIIATIVGILTLFLSGIGDGEQKHKALASALRNNLEKYIANMKL